MKFLILLLGLLIGSISCQASTDWENSNTFVFVQYFTDQNCTVPVISGVVSLNVTQNSCYEYDGSGFWINATITNATTLQYCTYNASDCTSNEVISCTNYTSGVCVMLTNGSVLYNIIVPTTTPSKTPSTTTPTTPSTTTPSTTPSLTPTTPSIITPSSIGNNIKVGGLFGFVLIFLIAGVFTL